MKHQNIFTKLLKIAFYCVIGHFSFNIVAMFFYPGGHMINHDTTSYSIAYNFFSDLGRLQSWSNEPNTVSFVLFNLSLICVCIGLSVYYFSLNYILNDSRRVVLLSRIGTVVAFICGLLFIGVGFTPADYILDTHVFFVQNAFKCFLLLVLIYSSAFYLSKNVPNYLILIYGAFIVLVAYYVYILLWVPLGENPTPSQLLFQVISQKVVVYGVGVCLISQIMEFMKRKYVENLKN